MGDATYQVKSDEACPFKGGHLSEASRSKQIADVRHRRRRKWPSRSTTSAASAAQTSGRDGQCAASGTAFGSGRAFIFRANDPAPDLTESVAI